MNALRPVVRDERGIAVVAALVALMALTALVLAFLSMSSWEPQIARNLADGTRARYVAEAGLEFGLNTLTNNTDWNALLASAASCTQGAVVDQLNRPLPGLTGTSGTFTVWVRNDCVPGDDKMTGVFPIETAAGAHRADTNNRVILVSEGRYGSSIKTLTAAVVRVPNVLTPTSGDAALNAALAFPGYQADTQFTGNSFEVDGRNHDLAGNRVAGTSVFGISVGPEDQFVQTGGPTMHHEDDVQTALGRNPQASDNVTGKDQYGGASSQSGDRTVAPGTMTSQAITDFVNAVEGFADITITSTETSTTTKVHASGTTTTSAGSAQFNNVGASCSGSYNAADCWGTPLNPKIVVIKGAMDTSSRFTALDIRGNSEGYGILVVEDGDLVLRGDFHWQGPVIVTGGYVGVGFMGGGNQDVLGALVSNETATNESPGFYEGVVQGNAKVHYSRAALDTALALLGRKTPTGTTRYVAVRMYNLKVQ